MEFNPSQLDPDELYLSGRIQVDAAINVLEMTSVNPQAEKTLKVLRSVHKLNTTPNAKDDLEVYLQGGTTDKMKADIIASALLAERNQTLSPEARVAAAGLLSVLGIEK